MSSYQYRFTSLARDVLRLADEEARHFQHQEPGTEHLLLGLVRKREGIGAEVLSPLGIEEHPVRQALEAML